MGKIIGIKEAGNGGLIDWNHVLVIRKGNFESRILLREDVSGWTISRFPLECYNFASWRNWLSLMGSWIINWLDARWRLPLFPTGGSLSIPCRSQLFPPPRYLLYPTLNYLLKEHLIFQLTSTRTQTSTMYKLCELHSTQGGAFTLAIVYWENEWNTTWDQHISQSFSCLRFSTRYSNNL